MVGAKLPLSAGLSTPDIFIAGLASVTVFFAYIGFDAVNTTAQEAANPQRSPIELSALLPFAQSFIWVYPAVFTGMPGSCGSLSESFVSTSVMLVLMIGQPRIFTPCQKMVYSPAMFSKMGAKSGSPYLATIASASVCALLAGFSLLISRQSYISWHSSAFFSLSTLVLRITEPISQERPDSWWLLDWWHADSFCLPFFSWALSQASVSPLHVCLSGWVLSFDIALYGYHHSVTGRQMAGKMVPEQRIQHN
ncbi:hypothetical protein BSLG_007082 [Batrachochytrium salamandrivorans]|nr:hypothetical protein BSLG_007082 [Batrachochytrium salamandrivorans]